MLFLVCSPAAKLVILRRTTMFFYKYYLLFSCNKLLIENGTIVMNFITLDNAYKAIEVMKKLNYIIDISQVNISKNRGKSYMMIANNPIYIVQCVRSVK